MLEKQQNTFFMNNFEMCSFLTKFRLCLWKIKSQLISMMKICCFVNIYMRSVIFFFMNNFSDDSLKMKMLCLKKWFKNFKKESRVLIAIRQKKSVKFLLIINEHCYLTFIFKKKKWKRTFFWIWNSWINCSFFMNIFWCCSLLMNDIDWV